MLLNYVTKLLGIGDWGLGIAQSPIPNPLIVLDIINLFKLEYIEYINGLQIRRYDNKLINK